MTNITDENDNLKKANYVEILRSNITPTKGISKIGNTKHTGETSFTKLNYQPQTLKITVNTNKK